MSVESKFEEFEFKNSFAARELEDRTEFVMSLVEGLYKNLKDDDALKEHYNSLKKTEKEEPGSMVDELIALVYLVCKRTLGEEWDILGVPYKWDLIPRDVQIQAGMVLCDYINENKFIRVRTGEGKTLINLFPTAYHSIHGSVHVVTSNDYLAARDHAWIGPVLKKIGITTSYLPKEEKDKNEAKFKAYNAQVVFGSDKEFSFDFLRDSIRERGKPKLCNKREYVIVDEADHVMLDELKTPIVLSSITQYTDPAVPLAGEAINYIIEKQKATVESLKKEVEKGREDFDDQKEYLKKIVQLKYSGHAEEWLDELFSKHPSLATEIIKFEYDYLTEMSYFNHVESGLFFIVDQKDKACALTEMGMKEIENKDPVLKELFLVPDYESLKRKIRESDIGKYHKANKLKKLDENYVAHITLLSAIHQALIANTILEKDVDYIITDEVITTEEGEIITTKDGEIIKEKKVNLVNPSTGRAEPSKKYQKGLSPAVEFKEGLPPSEIDIVVTSTTFPGLLSQYKRICSMSGTITPNQKELKLLYNTNCFDIPPHVCSIVKNFPTKLYATKEEKRSAILEDILWNHSLGRPVLIGSKSVKNSEEFAKLLDKEKIQYDLLNAKNEEKEAKIIAKAGELNAVTISTNMAGRGTDIKIPEGVNEIITENYVSNLIKIKDFYFKINIISHSEEEYNLLLSELQKRGIDVIDSRKKSMKQEYVISIRGKSEKTSKNILEKTLDFNSGLYILGEELDCSERINDQLKGRTGRQGQPGSSRFYVSLEDEIIKNSELASWILRNVLQDYTGYLSLLNPIKPLIKKAGIIFAKEAGVNKAQYLRSESLFYESTVEKQRKLTSELRKNLLEENKVNSIQEMIETVIEEFSNKSFKSFSNGNGIVEDNQRNRQLENFIYLVENTFNTSLSSLRSHFRKMMHEQPNYIQKIISSSYSHVMDLYKKRCNAFGNKNQEIEVTLMMNVLDKNWFNQMDVLESLKETAPLHSCGGMDPKVVYTKLAYKAFQYYEFNIMREFLQELFHKPLPQELSVRKKTSGVSNEIMELLH